MNGIAARRQFEPPSEVRRRSITIADASLIVLSASKDSLNVSGSLKLVTRWLSSSTSQMSWITSGMINCLKSDMRTMTLALSHMKSRNSSARSRVSASRLCDDQMKIMPRATSSSAMQKSLGCTSAIWSDADRTSKKATC